MKLVVLGGLALALCLIGIDIARHPTLVADPAAPLYIGALILIALGFLGATLLATPAVAPLAAIVGTAMSCFWLAELWAGNLAPPGFVTVILYRTSIAAVLMASLAGALVGGRVRGRLADGVSLGAMSGMLSGIVVCLALVTAGAVAREADGDSLAAGINHLWIGLGAGSMCGLVAGSVGAMWHASASGRPGSP